MRVLGICSLISWSMECSCITPLPMVVMITKGLVFQPLVCMILISGLYLVCLCMRACSGNLSW